MTQDVKKDKYNKVSLLQTIPQSHDKELSAHILNSNMFQNRSRTRPQSRNYAQKQVIRNSVNGLAPMSSQKRMSVHSLNQQS